MDVNKVTLIGRLTDKPDEKKLPNGKIMASFSIATNYMWKDWNTKEKKEKVDFHKVVIWGKLAEIAVTYLEKGSRIYIEGRLRYETWEDQQGKKRKAIRIIADEIIMLGHNGKSKSSEAFTEEEPDEQELIVEEV